MRRYALTAVLLINLATASPAQQPAPQPAKPAAPPAPSAPADHQEPADQPALSPAIVLEVSGRADWAAAGTSPLVNQGWTAIAVNDQLMPGTLIRTGLRSHVNLQFGQTTTVSIRSATFASIDQFYRTATTERVRVGLGYGAVRGGSIEGPAESDVTVDTPVATLAKRGTEGWQIFVEAGTGRFTISLADYGLVQAVKKLASDQTISRSVRPGEYATESNIANLWISQDIFDRHVWFYDPAATTDSEAAFAAENDRGLATLAPGAGREVRDASGRSSAAFVRQQTGARAHRGLPGGFTLAGPIARPEGNFGTAASFKALRR